MNESIVFLLSSFVAGIGFGAFYFGGLWFSVHRFLPREHAAAWFLLSFMLRNLIVLLGFYWIMNGSLERLLAALLGFTVVRVILSRRVARKLRSGA